MKLLLVYLLATVCSFAQSITGAISGIVTDSSDAVISGVSVRLASLATGAERTATTNEAGRFFFGSLQPGAYKIAVEAQGFRRLEQTNINVSAAETVSLPELKLQVGQVTDTVEVRAQGTIVQTKPPSEPVN